MVFRVEHHRGRFQVRSQAEGRTYSHVVYEVEPDERAEKFGGYARKRAREGYPVVREIAQFAFTPEALHRACQLCELYHGGF